MDVKHGLGKAVRQILKYTWIKMGEYGKQMNGSWKLRKKEVCGSYTEKTR